MDSVQPQGTAKQRPLRKLFLEAGLLFIGLVVCIIAMTWPWATYIDHAFISHWDPPLHAWKVIGVAKALLAGHLLPTGTNMNVYYPHPGSLYFESLYWPQAVVAALFLKLSSNPVLAFHLSYLFFWALSGVCFWLFLREVGIRRPISYLGALFFTIMPYRMSYLVEFNMQMCFGIPLVLLFIARFFRNPGGWNAVLASFFLCLQAVSELYQAVFLSLCLPFFIMPLLSRRWSLLRSLRRFWLPVVLAGAVALVFVGLYLWPYLLCLDNSLSRSLSESHLHRLEPFSYLVAYKHTAWRLLPELASKESEMCAYATLPVLLLVGAFLVGLGRFRLSRANRTENRVAFVLRLARAGLFLLFLTIATVNYNTRDLLLPGLFSWLPVVIAFLTLVIPVFTTYRSDRERLLDGLLGGAVFAFFMSLGPFIQCGNECPHVTNLLYISLYKVSDVLHGFRVVSRFSLFVLLFDIVAACVVVSKLLDSPLARGRYGKAPLVVLVLLPAMALSILESIPRRRPPTPVEIADSPVLRRLDERTEPYILSIVPFGDRRVDSLDMFQIGEEKRILVWAWGGTFPTFTEKLRRHFKRIEEDPRLFRDHLNALWPECFLLLHRGHLEQAFTPETRGLILDRLHSIADTVDDDHDQLALLKLHPSDPSTNVIKLIRHDFMRPNSSLRFMARLAPGAVERSKVSVEMNGSPLPSFEATQEETEFVVPYPGKLISITGPNTLRFTCGTPVSITDFSLIP